MSAATTTRILQFAKTYYAPMTSSLRDTNLFFAVMLAQASNESGYGTSYSAVHRNNFFGIMTDRTHKRVFPSIQACLTYYINNFNSPRYLATGVLSAATPYDQIRAIANAGYYSCNNDVKSSLSPALQAKFGKITNKESADWYYNKNKPLLDAILLSIPVGKITSVNIAAINTQITSLNV